MKTRMKTIAKKLSVGLVMVAVLFGSGTLPMPVHADFWDDLVDFVNPKEHIKDISDGKLPGSDFFNPLPGLPTDFANPTFPDWDDLNPLENQPLIPRVENRGSSDVEMHEATLEGYVNPNGAGNTVAWFEWGPRGNMNRETEKHAAPIQSKVEVEIKGLSPNTEYCFRIVARASFGGERKSSTKCFTTPALVQSNIFPAVRTDPADIIETYSARIHGYVDAKTTPTVGYFQWGREEGIQGGPSALVKNRTPNIETGQPDRYSRAISYTLTGLLPDTIYNYRAVAVNPVGTVYGAILQFKTCPVDHHANSWLNWLVPVAYAHETDDCVPVTSDLNVQCVADFTNLQINQTVRYTANATGGASSYTYSWSGTDNLSGSTQSVTKSYGTAGAKQATVTVTSGGQQKTHTCNVNVQTVAQPLAVTCSVNRSTANINENIQWAAHPTGGSGIYLYSWSGTDGVHGGGQTTLHVYSTTGTKTATVAVTSDGQVAYATCSTTIMTDTVPEVFNASCSANRSSAQIGESIIWTAYPTGGTGNYKYSWSGSENLSGSTQSVERSYSTVGSKTATVTVETRGQTITRTCSTVITGITQGSLSVACNASPSTARIGEIINWYTTVSGGTGSYAFSWTGTDGLAGSNSSVQKAYYDVGTKNATVTVYSGSESQTRTCSATVVHGGGGGGGGGLNQPNVYLISKNVTKAPLAQGGTGSFIYLNQVPYTGLTDHPILTSLLVAFLAWSFIFGMFYFMKRSKMQKAAAGMSNDTGSNDAFTTTYSADAHEQFGAELESFARGKNALVAQSVIDQLYSETGGNLDRAMLTLDWAISSEKSQLLSSEQDEMITITPSKLVQSE